MSEYTEHQLGILIDDEGNKRLSGARFSNTRFSEFSLGPIRRPGERYVIEYTRFEDCRVEPGEFAIRAGVMLRDVLFENVASKDGIIMSTHVGLDRVKFTGHHENGGLWVKPDSVVEPELATSLTAWAESVAAGTDVMLDIMDYRAPDVAILGIPIEKTLFDSSRYVHLRSAWSREVDWESLDIPPTSFFRIRLRYLKGFGVDSGIFSLPLRTDRKFEQTIAEMERLRRLGLLGE